MCPNFCGGRGGGGARLTPRLKFPVFVRRAGNMKIPNATNYVPKHSDKKKSVVQNSKPEVLVKLFICR